MAIVALPPPPPVAALVCPQEARDLSPGVRCGTIRVPLDRARDGGRTIRIYFEHYRRRDRTRPASSTVVSLEGGPGYGVTDGRSDRVELWAPVSGRRDLLLVDLRGTGRSGALACRAFARTSAGYIRRAGRCARELGPRRDLYATADAVDDVQDVLRAVRARTIDLYGDSYGSYAAQAFAVRHPERLRTLVLDATYPLPGTDPAFADLVAAIRRGLRLSCARRPGCPAAQRRTDPVALVARFADRVRARPIVGWAPDYDGALRRVRLDEDVLVQTIGASYYSYPLWRDLLAAIVAAQRGDSRPILRLAAEHRLSTASSAPASFSEALYLAVVCHDYPQLWSPETPIARRPVEARARVAAYPRGTFTPFSAQAWTGVEIEGALACLRWPTPVAGPPPLPPDAVFPSVPTLVLNGDLDTITASSGARRVARTFPRSMFVELHNSVHVTALGDADRCASLIYARFVKSRRAGDTSCARRIPELRVMPRFAQSLGEVDAGRPAPENEAAASGRRIAVASARTVADVLSRWWLNYDGDGVGLRGGRWAYEGDEVVTFYLDAVQLVPGVAVSGTVTWDRSGPLIARVRTEAPRGVAAELTLRWTLARPLARASLVGWVGGQRLRATMLAP